MNIKGLKIIVAFKNNLTSMIVFFVFLRRKIIQKNNLTTHLTSAWWFVFLCLVQGICLDVHLFFSPFFYFNLCKWQHYSFFFGKRQKGTIVMTTKSWNQNQLLINCSIGTDIEQLWLRQFFLYFGKISFWRCAYPVKNTAMKDKTYVIAGHGEKSVGLSNK